MPITKRWFLSGRPVSACVAITRESLYDGLALPTLETAGVGEIVEARGYGCAAAQWNAALREATNDICIIAADDLYYSPDLANRLIHAAEVYRDADLFYGDHLEVGSRMLMPFIHAHRSLEWGDSYFAHFNHIGLYAIRKSKVGDTPFDESLTRYEDWDLLWRTFDRGGVGVRVGGAWAVALFIGKCLSVPETERVSRAALYRKRGIVL